MTALWIYFGALVGFALGVALMCCLHVSATADPATRAQLGAVPILAAVIVLVLGIGICIGLATGGAS